MPQILAAYIKSNRSKCKKCQKFIIPDGVKLGVNISDRNGYKRIDWFHEQCFGKIQMWGVRELDVQDIEQLADGDRKRILSKLELILFQKNG
ncbi:hypothetical protein pb186bvf_015359 [Paramecium bursaria]